VDAETDAAGRKAWLETLKEVQALGPTTFVAGHKDPKLRDDVTAVEMTRSYLRDFDAAVAASKTCRRAGGEGEGGVPEAAAADRAAHRRRGGLPSGLRPQAAKK
jgi:hypothetical protein